jgi:hypothetical protein
MIPTIGFMIGAYIFIRAADMFFQERPRRTENHLIRALCVVLILVDTLLCISLFLSSVNTENALGGLR